MRTTPTLTQRYQMLSVEAVREFHCLTGEQMELVDRVVALLNAGHTVNGVEHFTWVMPSTIHAIANDPRYGVIPLEDRQEIMRRSVRQYRQVETIKGLIRQIRKVARDRRV